MKLGGLASTLIAIAPGDSFAVPVSAGPRGLFREEAEKTEPKPVPWAPVA
jgi:hypothetical protein